MPTKNVRSRSFALSLYFGAVTATLGAPDELDPTFGTNGVVQIDVEQNDDANVPEPAARQFAVEALHPAFSALDVRGRRPSRGAGEEPRVFTSMARRTT